MLRKNGKTLMALNFARYPYIHEYIYHGGCLLTRLEVYRLESVEGRPEVGIGSADWWAFSKPAADLTGVDVEAERQFAIQCFPELF